jgi:hypothetical protein
VTNVKMTAGMIALVAERFKALGEPARLEILNSLRGGAGAGQRVQASAVSAPGGVREAAEERRVHVLFARRQGHLLAVRSDVRADRTRNGEPAEDARGQVSESRAAAEENAPRVSVRAVVTAIDVQVACAARARAHSARARHYHRNRSHPRTRKPRCRIRASSDPAPPTVRC